MRTFNKTLLREFLAFDNKQVTEAHYKEIKKVTRALLEKYHANKVHLFKDLEDHAVGAVLSLKHLYDTRYDGYNFIYTIIRNELGNKLRLWERESYLDDIGGYRDRDEDEGVIQSNISSMEDSYEQGDSYEDEGFHVWSDTINKYKSYLDGTVSFEFKRVNKADLAELLYLICKLYHRIKPSPLPDYIEEDENTSSILWSMVKSLNKFN